MLISAARLLARVRNLPSRVDELRALDRRVRTHRRETPGDAERATAVAIAALKRRVAEATGTVTSCRSCARGKPAPRGTFAGGDCCSGVTAELFDDGEVAALVQAGTRKGDLVAPRTEHAGCAFRGPVGCTLAPVHRPGLCLHYLCDSLRRELHARGQLDDIEQLLAELDRRMSQFLALREARLDRELVEG